MYNFVFPIHLSCKFYLFKLKSPHRREENMKSKLPHLGIKPRTFLLSVLNIFPYLSINVLNKLKTCFCIFIYKNDRHVRIEVTLTTENHGTHTTAYETTPLRGHNSSKNEKPIPPPDADKSVDSASEIGMCEISNVLLVH